LLPLSYHSACSQQKRQQAAALRNNYGKRIKVVKLIASSVNRAFPSVTGTAVLSCLPR
jgi:hypothetical protein